MAVRPVVVLGDPVVDIYLRVDDVRNLTDKVTAAPLGRFGGGMAANVAACAVQFGTPTFIVGCVGDDPWADDALADLASCGVGTEWVTRQPGAATGYTMVLLDARGERLIFVVPPTKTVPPPWTSSLEQAISGAAALYVSWTYPDFARRAIACARTHSVPVLMDVERAILEEHSPDIIAYADLVFFNREGLTKFAPGLSLVDGLRRALAMGPRLAAVTLGAEGAVVATAAEVVSQPGFRVHVVDTTGAGDCFLAAFLHAYLHQWPLAATVQFANAASALAVTRMGPRQGVPTREEVVRFLQTRIPGWQLPRPDGVS